VFWGTVKAYKGVELMLDLARTERWRAQGLALEVHGRWDAELAPLKADLLLAGVRVVDEFLDAAALRALLSRPVVFLLPYRHASQSGALFTLLHQGCRFVCAGVGDLGDFLRLHQLSRLLLNERSVEAVIAAMQALTAEPLACAEALQRAQDDCAWDVTLAHADRVYDPAPAMTP
jgi:glycosyltransferase involved in cell wall biosynthesis